MVESKLAQFADDDGDGLPPRPNSQDFDMPNIFSWPKETANHVIEEDASRSPSHDAEGHCGPSEMDRPAHQAR
jgi:hypothetical protein